MNGADVLLLLHELRRYRTYSQCSVVALRKLKDVIYRDIALSSWLYVQGPDGRMWCWSLGYDM